MSVSLLKEMNACFRELNVAEQQSVLQMVKTFLESRQNKRRLSINQYNNDIDKAMNRINKGKFITQEDVEKESEEW